MENTNRKPDAPFYIGAAVISETGSLGYVAAICAEPSNIFSLGSGAMVRETKRIRVVFEGHYTDAGESMEQRWRNRAADMPDCLDLPAWVEAANAQTDARRERAKLAEIERAERAAAFRAEARAKVPEWAQAAIVAEQVKDQSDSMTDYFGHTTLRTVIIGFSRHTRDLFPELRKCAATFPETAHLTDAPESAEHREKYSMGHGYYLKSGWRDSDGWSVRKVKFYGKGADGCPQGEFHLCEPSPAPRVAAISAAEPSGAFAIKRHAHTKGGFDMWIAVPAARVERDQWEAQRDVAKALGGWWSRPWGKTPGGFAFKSEAAARDFVGADSAIAPEAAAPVTRAAPNPAGKLRTMADNLQSDIDRAFADRLTNTPKRQREAGNARNEGAQLERAQAAMRALADCHDAGTVPAALAKVATKAEILRLSRERIDYAGGYYNSGRCTGAPALPDDPGAVALWGLLKTPRDGERERQEDLRRKVESLQFAKIPGYFPTPAPLAARLIREADLLPGARILEPSAGSGAIADAARDAGHVVDCIERHASLCEVLRLKGHAVTQSDFMEAAPPAEPFDAVLMNPPFEQGQDCDHVRHAFGFVKPGGALVAIMGAGVTFRQDRRYADFRAWIDAQGGTIEPLPAGAFKESGTGVATVLCVIHRATPHSE